MNVSLEKVQEFFFEAMNHGYAGDGQVVKVDDMPGFKQMLFRQGDFQCMDRWGGPPSSLYSTGTTTIWCKGAPVWVMSYGGWYNYSAIPVLRVALRENYAKKVFTGCRGPQNFQVRSQLQKYINSCSGSFVSFSGKEEIRHIISGALCGYHVYGGMSLLER